MTRINEKLVPIVSAALEAGFTAFVLKERNNRPAGFVYVCLDAAGSFAAVEMPTHRFEPVSLSALIVPSRDYGSSVLVDYDETPAGAVEALRAVCSSPTVTVRFVAKRGKLAPVVPNQGPRALTSWPGGGAENFEPVTAELLQNSAQS